VCVWWSLPDRRIRNAHGRQQAIKLKESQVQEAKQMSAELGDVRGEWKARLDMQRSTCLGELRLAVVVKATDHTQLLTMCTVVQQEDYLRQAYIQI
jgi:hypothetical protein